MASSASTKTKLIKRLEDRYGKNWKTPLSKDLGVHLSTVKRQFNQRKKLRPMFEKAVEMVLQGRS